MATGRAAMPSLVLRRWLPADCKTSSVGKMGAQSFGVHSSDGARDMNHVRAKRGWGAKTGNVMSQLFRAALQGVISFV